MMARREYKLQKRCAHEGCTEIGRWTFDTARDLSSSFAQRHEYRCVRHTAPNEVLGSECQSIETVLTSQSSDQAPGLYWNGRSGFVHGPGFKAWAKDFPEGTRLVLTVRVELPSEIEVNKS